MRLKELRGKKTQGYIAEMLGIPRETYRGYEVGIRQPDLKMLIKMADYFQVSVDFLIGREVCETNRLSPFDEKLNLLNGLGRQKVTDYIDDLLTNPQYCSAAEKVSAKAVVDVSNLSEQQRNQVEAYIRGMKQIEFEKLNKKMEG